MSLKRKIAQLVVSLGLDSASYKEGMKRAKKDAHGFSDSAKQAVTNARREINRAGVAIGAASAAVTAATAVMVKQQMASIDQMAKFSDRIGLTTQALAGMRHQAELNGVAQRQMDTGLQRMVRRVAEAAQGTGEAKNAIKELGLNAQQLAAMRPDQQFAAIAEQMKNVEGQSNRVRLAFKLFDSEGVGMVNMMRDGAAGLAAAQKEALSLGIAVNRIDAAKIEAANDATYRATQAMDGLGKSITIAVAPYITEIANEFFNASKESNGFRDQVASGMEIAVKSVGYVGNAIRGMQLLWKGAQVLVATFATFTFDSLQTVRDSLVEVANLIPGVSIDVDPNSGLSLMAKVAREQLDGLKTELHEMAMKELPSEAAEKWFKKVQAQADEAARKVERAQSALNSTSGTGTPFAESSEVGSVDKALEAELRKNDTYQQVFARRQEMLANALETNQITEQRYAEISLKNLQVYNQARLQAEAEKNAAIVGSAQSFFANMATLSEHGNRRLSMIGRAAAIVNVVIGTIEAAQNAYKVASAWGGPVAGAAAAAAAGIAGMMRLRALKQVQPGSSASLSAGGLNGQTTFDQQLPSSNASMPDKSIGMESFNRDTQDRLNAAGERKEPTYNFIEDASKAGRVEQLTEQDVVNIYVSNIHNQGEIARAQESAYNLARVGT